MINVTESDMKYCVQSRHYEELDKIYAISNDEVLLIFYIRSFHNVNYVSEIIETEN